MTTPGPAAYRPFGVRLREAMATHGPLCAGVDPHRGLVESWGLAYDLSGLERFAMTCVEAFAGDVASVKPQSAFFEVFGARGVAVLERAVDAFTEAGTIVILDAKRGDIGSTMDAYAEAFLGKDAPSPADAVTVSPYLGYGSLRPAIDLAGHTGRGVFVLALTSNPEGPSVQHAQRDGISVARAIVEGAAADNAEAASRGEMGHVGLVVGATIGSALADLGIDLAASAAPILAPGLGAQGATPADLRAVFGAALPQVLPNASRSILAAGPDVSALRAAAREESERLAEMLVS
ncbi:MAG TPA: orotidine-5'-phosphate decarboxylase [Phycicoccus elongatus]|uniref:orotidine-5'-phosphate decarboxylase n=1 Tax=Phycicoccus TaxID=367298 RepID=UPI001E181820|nr:MULTISPECIES: orotidine-5'-phosphate decarboxylase [Phycicoccus]MBK8728013.1 orotidine-5'-phosphate decarboxylase [Tetrasphaera sp.]MCB1238448.1 orotidine-5'-phosphate decarboxylase [Tetrasphaera sp.]MCB9405371.1 orotidine-5'-phosphate decarboxylase [Tetrasphaera sp.]HOA66362.1 orotidine-5'-phosphate decarboxylase [Phycicoccus elongatus]HPF75968.1 orotidine-5'-phosphate decarboxylase [Phycicoccus elongatus]